MKNLYRLIELFYLGCNIAWLLCFSSTLQAQNALFSQYYNPTPLFSNPAWSAAHTEVSAGLHFRRQQIGIGQGIASSAFEFSLPLSDAYNNQKGGLGIGLLNERAGKGGLLQTNAFLLGLAYQVSLSDHDYLAFGLQGGYFFRSLNSNLFTTESQYTINGFDASLPTNEPLNSFRSDFPSINAGLLWYGKDEQEHILYYLGVSGYTLNRPTTTWFADVSRIPVLLNVSGEYTAWQKNNWTLHPTARYIYQTGKNSASIGFLWRYTFQPTTTTLRNSDRTYLAMGIWYNTNKATILSVDIRQKNYQFVVSYDLAIANRNVLGQTSSAIEISLIWKKPFERSKKIPLNKKKKNTSSPVSVSQADSTKKVLESQTHIDTSQTKFREGLGMRNKVEKKGSLRVIVREPVELIAPKKKNPLNTSEKAILEPVLADSKGILEVDVDKIAQIAQILFRDGSRKLKIVLYYTDESEKEWLISQADDLKKQLILQGVEPQNMIRQNIFRKGKSIVEWVILKK